MAKREVVHGWCNPHVAHTFATEGCSMRVYDCPLVMRIDGLEHRRNNWNRRFHFVHDDTADLAIRGRAVEVLKHKPQHIAAAVWGAENITIALLDAVCEVYGDKR